MLYQKNERHGWHHPFPQFQPVSLEHDERFCASFVPKEMMDVPLRRGEEVADEAGEDVQGDEASEDEDDELVTALMMLSQRSGLSADNDTGRSRDVWRRRLW
eukprot:jgi/Chlat1/1598/Chrsp124S08672